MPEPRIGLEIHIQLDTASKLFCACPSEWNAGPNTNVCPVCMGYPGALPVLNGEAVLRAMRLALAVGGTVHLESRFDRKNYFYPDLPKGYQITQHSRPLSTGGALAFGPSGAERSARITRIHIEEDAAKLIHDRGDATLIDFNRCGVPLVELVTEPDLTSGDNAAAFVAELQRLVRWLGIGGAAMERGELRCDVNVSLAGHEERTEVKNLNSLRAIREAVAYETARQARLVDEGRTVEAGTYGWDEARKETFPMRAKETAAQYRYLPEPDLLPLRVSEEQIAEARAALPELPRQAETRFVMDFDMAAEIAGLLTSDRELAGYYERAAKVLPNDPAQYRLLASWTAGEALRAMHERDETAAAFPIGPERIAALITRIADGTVSGTAAKQVFAEMLNSDEEPDTIIARLNLGQMTDERALRAAVEDALAANPDAAAQVRRGKTRAAGFLVGQVMKATGGKANPERVRAIIGELLEEQP